MFGRRGFLKGLLAAPAAVVAGKELVKYEGTKEVAKSLPEIPPPPPPAWSSGNVMMVSCVVTYTTSANYPHYPNNFWIKAGGSDSNS